MKEFSLSLQEQHKEQFINELEKNKYLFQEYSLVKDKSDNLVHIGHGTTADIYEVSKEDCPGEHYVLRVAEMINNKSSSDKFWKTYRLQKILSSESKYVVDPLEAKVLAVKFDLNGNFYYIEEIYEKTEDWDTSGRLFQFTIMKKYVPVLCHDDINRVSLIPELNNIDGVIKLTNNIGNALIYAHKRKVLHRDIKLENIVYDKETNTYLLGDFDTAGEIKTNGASTKIFSDGYGAPEIVKELVSGYKSTADIYSFGMTLYVILNDLKFPGSDNYRAIPVHYTSNFVFPAPVNATPELTNILRKMCSFRCEDRYQHIEEAVYDLQLAYGLMVLSRENDEEYDDIGTATYCQFEDDYDEFGTRTYCYAEDDNEQDSSTAEQIREEKEQSKLNLRLEKLKEKGKLKQQYKYGFIEIIVWCTFLTMFLLTAGNLDKSTVVRPDFWILCFALLELSCAIHVREFHILSFIIFILLFVISLMNNPLTLYHILMLLAVLNFTPPVMAGCAIGSFIWIIFYLNGLPGFLSWPLRWHIICIVVVVTYWMYETSIHDAMVVNKMRSYEEKISIYVYVVLPYILLITGLAVKFIFKNSSIPIVSELSKLNLIVSSIMMILYQYGILTDESLDDEDDYDDYDDEEYYMDEDDYVETENYK